MHPNTLTERGSGRVLTPGTLPLLYLDMYWTTLYMKGLRSGVPACNKATTANGMQWNGTEE